MTVQSLIPNSQDISSFYLRNIYQVLADPNATLTSVPSPIAKPLPFSPPNYAVWVNSLWFLSLVISLICALLASSLHQWARRYFRVTQPAGCGPEKRARVRAFYANGLKILPNSRIVEALPTLLHLSLFLFFAGLVILLVNVNHAVSNCVVWLIGLFSIVYGLITVLPIVRHDSPYYSPLSPLAWYMYTGTRYLFLKVLFPIRSGRIRDFETWQRLRDLRDRYYRWILGGREKAAEEMALDSVRSSDTDADILLWAIDALGGDDRMANFLEVIPGFFNSKSVKNLKRKLPDVFRKKFWMALNGFFERTLSSKSIIEDATKYHRLDIGMNAIRTITIPDIPSIPKEILFKPWDQMLQNVEMGHAMARWRTSDNGDVAQYAQCIATRILTSVREYNDRWIALATNILGLPGDTLRKYVTHGDDSVSLAILISVARRHIHSPSDFYDWGLMSTLYKFHILNSLPELQHAFCQLWNECVEEASKQPLDTLPVGILRLTRFLYIRLHRDTPAAPRLFSASTPDFDHILFQPRSYPLCNIRDHHPDTTQPGDSPNASLHQPTYGRSDALRLAEELNVITDTPLHDMIAREMRESSLASPAISPALPVQTDPYPLDSENWQDVSTAPILDQPSGFYDAGPIYTSTPQLPASPTLPTSPSHILRLPNPELLALLSGTPLSGPSDSATLSRLCARGLINQGSMSFINAILQVLVYCPPFWNLFSDLGWLMGQTGQRGQGGQQTKGGTTLLVDATVRLLDEFAYKEDDDREPFTPTCVYDAMKEKRQFESMLVRSCAQVAPLYLLICCWPTLYRADSSGMRKNILASISTRLTKSCSHY